MLSKLPAKKHFSIGQLTPYSVCNAQPAAVFCGRISSEWYKSVLRRPFAPSLILSNTVYVDPYTFELSSQCVTPLICYINIRNNSYEFM